MPLSEAPPIETVDRDLAPAPSPDDDAIAQEVQSQAIDDGKGNKMVPLSALIGAKKELRTVQKRNRELEPVVERTARLQADLDNAMPVIQAINNDPRLKAEALRIAQGSAPSRLTTDQPLEDEDARGYAEDMGWYLADQVTPDAARGRRVLERQGKMMRQHAEDVMRPLAGVTLGSRAEVNLARIIGMTDDQGVPYATPESIRAVAKDLPANLLADERVTQMVLRNAIGEDRMNRRTPVALDEPLRLDRQGGSGPRAETLTPEQRRINARVGLSDKDFTDTMQKLAQSGGRGLKLE